MLVAKFTVPISRKIYTDVLKYASRSRQCGNKEKCQKSSTIRQELTKECQEKLKKNPVPHNEYCKIQSAADNYQKAYQDTKNQGEAIMKSFLDESSLMLNKLRKDIDTSNANEKLLLERVSNDVMKKVQQLLILDPTCGSLKRKCAMSLGDQASQAFENVGNDIALQMKRINTIVKNLESDVFICVERAKSLILSCCKSSNTLTLNKCIEKNGNYAKKILDKTSKDVQTGLNKIEALKRDILEYNKSSLAEISQTYSKKNKAFLKYLDDCIYDLRKKKKR